MKRFLVLPALLAMFQLQAQQIEEYRYWINDDPTGVTMAGIGPNVQVNLVSSLPLPTLTKDYNMITIQFKDTNDVYSVPVSSIFTRNTGAVTGCEYWIDDAVANRVTETITAGNTVTLSENIPLCLTAGTHLFTIRFKGASGTWSVPITRQFTATASADTDGDGLCDALDPCPLLANVVPGQSCNDNNACTVNDLVDANCNCAGTFADTDNDGTCDASDLCPGGAEPGTPCDDLNTNTSGDVIGPNCICAGALIDCLGVPGGTAVPGTPCNDNDACTTNDIYQLDCGCAGTIQDNDGDGTCDANDLCPGGPEPGTACNDNDANTDNDVMDANCQCVGTPVGCSANEVKLTLNTDLNGGQTSWEIVVQSTTTVVCSGPLTPPYPNSSTIVESCCLPDGCYELIVHDSFGDGMTFGGYVLRDANNVRIIDNANNGGFTFVSTIADHLGFCLPIGPDHLTAATCDQESLATTSVLHAEPNAAVTAQYGVTNSTSGYQYWIFDPNGSYNRMIFLSHASPGSGYPGGTPAALRSSYLKLSSLVTLPVPQNVLLNVRVRGRIAGVYNEWGSACRMKIGPPPCPTTQLVATPGPTFSCGVTGKVVGASGDIGKIWANAVTGGNKYRFRFVQSAHGYLRDIASNTAVLTLGPWSTQPLLCGTFTYDVSVAPSLNGGSTYCPFGVVCTVGITNNGGSIACTTPVQGGGGNLNISASDAERELRIFPNPNDGERLTLALEGIAPEIMEVSVDIYDSFGKIVLERTIQTDGGEELNHVMELDSSLPAGMYVVTVTVGDQAFTKRLICE